MRRYLLFLFLILFQTLIFAQEIQWITGKNTQIQLYDDPSVINIQKNESIKPSEYSYLDYKTNLIGYVYYDNYEGKIIADDIIPRNSKELFASDIISNKEIIVPYYYFLILSENNRSVFNDMFMSVIETLMGEYYNIHEAYEYIIEMSSLRQLMIKNAIIEMEANNLQSYIFHVNKIEKLLDGYSCIGKSYSRGLKGFFIKEPSEGIHRLLIIFDGDYINIYEDSKDKLLMTYAISDEKTIKEFNTLIRTGVCDLSKITWPRHADGTCDYDKKIIPPKFNFADIKTNPVNLEQKKEKKVSVPFVTNVSINKTMLVSENLKLRSGEATTSEVLTVMSAGTKVKILELGKAETIDGINSNWVKVEVQAGAKDRDGRAIRAGTVGWCYGGYLK